MTFSNNQKRQCKEICIKYQVKKPTEGRGRYESGQAHCQICEIWIDHNGCLLKDGSPATEGSVGWTCKCCNYRVRQKPRNIVYKEKLRNKKNIKIEKTRDAVIAENNKYSNEIPQANNLERLIYLVDFISKDIIYPEELAKRLGIDLRQVMYYTQAAQMLELIEQYRKDSSNFYKITSYAENLLKKKWPDRFIVIREKIKKIPLYKKLLESLEPEDVNILKQYLDSYCKMKEP